MLRIRVKTYFTRVGAQVIGQRGQFQIAVIALEVHLVLQETCGCWEREAVTGRTPGPALGLPQGKGRSRINTGSAVRRQDGRAPCHALRGTPTSRIGVGLQLEGSGRHFLLQDLPEDPGHRLALVQRVVAHDHALVLRGLEAEGDVAVVVYDARALDLQGGGAWRREAVRGACELSYVWQSHGYVGPKDCYLSLHTIN